LRSDPFGPESKQLLDRHFIEPFTELDVEIDRLRRSAEHAVENRRPPMPRLLFWPPGSMAKTGDGG
jgi:hypothetical protein